VPLTLVAVVKRDHLVDLTYRETDDDPRPIILNRYPPAQVAVRASADGRFTFEIFSVSGEPRTLQVGSQYYATPDDAERAGYAAIAAKGL
jgi:hypothetical protein